jgi:hypothetical protein
MVRLFNFEIKMFLVNPRCLSKSSLNRSNGCQQVLILNGGCRW